MYEKIIVIRVKLEVCFHNQAIYFLAATKRERCKKGDEERTKAES